MTPEFILADKTATEEALDRYLPAVSTDWAVVVDAMRYALMNGGKRIRPCIVIEFAKACGGSAEEALSFAAAIEMIHTYSLIHDDLPCMDNDDMRRGKPSCHKKYGYANALLAGDALISAAFQTIVSDEDIPASRRTEAVAALARLSGACGMVGGQIMDLEGEGKDVSYDELKEINRLKTGALLAASAELGCISAGADKEKRKAAIEYTEYLGEAFQIVDDILDIEGDESKLGKHTGSDALNDKRTYARTYGTAEARKEAARLTKLACDSLAVFGAKADNLRRLAEYLLDRDH